MVSVLPIRDVEITALSPRAELLAVVRVAVAVVVSVAAYLFAPVGTSGRSSGVPAARNLLPYQALIQAHDVVDQKMFRSLQVALLEAQNARGATGQWPDVQAMAAEGIDPFAVDPTNKGARYTWQTLRNGLIVNYLGLPDRDDAPAWLLVVQEPDPSGPPEIYTKDEEHAQLLDGTVVHVGIWRHANGGRLVPGPVRVPQAAGWSQVFAAGPAPGH